MVVVMQGACKTPGSEKRQAIGATAFLRETGAVTHTGSEATNRIIGLENARNGQVLAG